MAEDKLNFCPNCGNELGSNKTFCIKCGKKLIETNYNKNQQILSNESTNTKNNTKSTHPDSYNKNNTLKDTNRKKSNNKVIAGIILIFIIAILAYQFVYVPYNTEQNNIKFEENLKAASDFEKKSDNLTVEHGNKYNRVLTTATNKKEYSDMLIEHQTFLLNEYLPDLKKEMEMLNETLKYTNGNQTKIDYINYQIERLEIEYQSGANESENMVNMVADFNLEEINKLEKDFDEMSLNDNNTNITLNSWSLKLKTLLNNNPEYYQTIKEYDLFEEFYGDFKTSDG